MKAPTNRSAFMDELAATLDDVLCGKVQRSWMSRRNISAIVGHEFYIEYTEEFAPQLIDFQHHGSRKKVLLECCDLEDGVVIKVDNEYKQTLRYDEYKNKVSYAAAVAVWVDRYAC